MKRVPTGFIQTMDSSVKSLNLKLKISRPGKSSKKALFVENPGKVPDSRLYWSWNSSQCGVFA